MRYFTMACLLLLSGCTSIGFKLEWNRLRVGDIREIRQANEDGSWMEMSQTLGLDIRWAPNANLPCMSWKTYMNCMTLGVYELDWTKTE